jgi:hypothetical protein
MIMSLKSQLNELQVILNKLKSDKERYRSGLSLNHHQIKALDNAIHQMQQDYDTLLSRQEKIMLCIKKHPLVQKIKKESKALMKINEGSLTLMQARNQMAHDYHYQNWDDMIEKLALELDDYLVNNDLDNVSLTQENQIAINLGKNQYAMSCYLKPEHWSAHLGLIGCPQLIEQFQLFSTHHKIVMFGDFNDEDIKTGLSKTGLSGEKMLDLNLDDNWHIWSEQHQGLAYINHNHKEVKKNIRDYLLTRMKMNNRDNELWLINSNQCLDMLEPAVIAQIRSLNIHLIINYSSLLDFTHNEMIANNVQSKIFNTQTYNPVLLSSIFAYPLSQYQMPPHQSRLAIIQQNRITELSGSDFSDC